MNTPQKCNIEKPHVWPYLRAVFAIIVYNPPTAVGLWGGVNLNRSQGASFQDEIFHMESASDAGLGSG